MARIGLRLATRRAMRPKCSGLPKVSTYRMTALVASSSSQYSSRSLVETSARPPSDAKLDRPSRRAAASPSSAMPIARDCEEIARRPAGAGAPAKVPRRLTDASLFSTPSVLGPTMRKPADRTISSSCRCRLVSSPSSSASLESTSRALAPMRAASAATSSTSSSGTATTTSSGGSARSLRLRAARTECTTPPFRFTGTAAPWKPPAIRLANRSPPRLPGSLEAPTTAIEAGARIERSDATTPTWSRFPILSCTASVGWMSKETSSSSKSNLLRTPNPARPKTASIAWLLSMTSASKRAIPCSAPISASCSRIRVATPRPWRSSATVNATSATAGSRSRS